LKMLTLREMECMGAIMLKRFTAFVIFVLMLTPAAAGADSNTVRKFGLLGTWAVDCTKPPSNDNPYEEYTPSESGYPIRTFYYVVGSRHSFEMRNARIGPPDRLAYLDVRKSDGDRTNVVIQKVGERQRSYEAIDPNDGKVYIKDGKLVATGKPTMVFEKCPRL